MTSRRSAAGASSTAHFSPDSDHPSPFGRAAVVTAELARRLGRIDAARVEEHRRVVAGYDLPMTVPAGLEPSHLVDLFSRDKKAVDGVTFVLDGPNGVEPVRIDDRALLLGAFDAVR